MKVKELITQLQTHNQDLEVHLGQGIEDDDHGYFPVTDQACDIQEELIDDKMVLMISDDMWPLINAGKI